MPEKKQEKKSVNVKPTQSWWSKYFGSEELTPDMLKAIEIARKENPNLAPIETYGLLSRLLMNRANAYTSPTGNIYLNPSQLQGYSVEDIADTLVHEQEHVNQVKQRNLGPIMEVFNNFGGDAYHRRPDEMEAFKAEMLRREKQGRGQTATPSFLTGQYYVPRDIRLRGK